MRKVGVFAVIFLTLTLLLAGCSTTLAGSGGAQGLRRVCLEHRV